MTKKTTYLMVLSFVFSFLLSPVYAADTFVVTVDGRNVNLDWSAMPDANSTTLYVALGDQIGDIDINTLAFANMGKTRTLYAPGLPSGLIIYAAVLAHTDQGDVVSNLAKFMPFGGTVTFPETGDVLMSLNDPGGMGEISIQGTRKTDGSVASITQITGNDSFSSYIINFSDGNIVSIIRDGSTTNYSYNADGSLNLKLTRAIETRGSNKAIDCSLSKQEYKNSLSSDPDFKHLYSQYLTAAGYPFRELKKLSTLATLLHQTKSAKDDIALIIAQYDDLSKKFEELRIIEEDKAINVFLNKYDKQCDQKDEVTLTVSGTPNVYINFSCPIPDMASVTFHETLFNGVKFEYYTWSGNTVGPYITLYQQDDGTFEYSEVRCYNNQGEKNGWSLMYRKIDHGLYYAGQFSNGVKNGIEYGFYQNGAWTEANYNNGEKTSSTYHQP